MVTILLLFHLSQNPELAPIYPSPVHLRFPNETEIPRHWYPGIDQIATDGQNLYLRNNRSATILIAEPSGRVTAAVGRQGQGPNEFGSTNAIAVHGKKWIVVDLMNGRFHLMQHTRHLGSIPMLATYAGRADPHNHAGTFALEENSFLLPLLPGDTALGAQLDHRGMIIAKFGIQPFNLNQHKDMLSLQTNMNHVTWIAMGNHYLAIFKYIPWVWTFRKTGKLVQKTELDDPYLQALYEDRIRGFQPKTRHQRPTPLIQDAQSKNDRLYILAEARVLECDLLGNILRILPIEIPHPQTGHLQPAYFQSFAITDQGNIYLSHPLNLGDADYWTAPLP